MAYGQDECLAWSVQLKSAVVQNPNGVQPGPRVAQWTSPSECNGDDSNVWYDPMVMGWSDYSAELNAALPGDNLLRGLVVDEAGIVWIALGNHQVQAAANPRLIRVDPTMKPPMIQTWGPETIKELLNPVGMSLDVEGYLWMVDSAANKAYKIDRANPASYTVVSGLVTPYTYSDMTG